MRIGLTIMTQEGHNLWNNGIGQNVYFLASLLETIPFVEQVFLIDTGTEGQAPGDSGSAGEKFALLAPKDALELADIAIEVSGAIPQDWHNDFKTRGGKTVQLVCGQPYSSMLDTTIFDRPGYLGAAGRHDEIWLLPKDRQHIAMVRALYRAPVVEMPYLWAPNFLQHTIDILAKDGLDFGYKSGQFAKQKLAPAIFEPNISVVKMGAIPFMICDGFERAHPQEISQLGFMNGLHLTKQKTFIAMVGQSALYESKRVTIHGRDYFAKVMANGANAVVSHQIDCAQNYLYLDTLYGNYPLIHTSDIHSDVGYYYAQSDISAGIEQLALAYAQHDQELDFYARRNAALFARLSPANKANATAYARRLLHVANHNSQQVGS